MIDGNLSVNKQQLEILKCALIAKGLSSTEEQSILLKINYEIEKIKAIETLLNKPVLFEVVYISEMGLYDGVTKHGKYGVIEELEHQYVVINDALFTSSLSKDKFIINS
jgi:hypothetical protein